MNYAQYIQLAIVLVQEVLSQVKGAQTEQNIVSDVQAALDALLKVQGSEVTFAQLEALRVNKTF